MPIFQPSPTQPQPQRPVTVGGMFGRQPHTRRPAAPKGPGLYIEGRDDLEAQYARAAGLEGPSAAPQMQQLAAQLGEIGTGREMGAGEMAARRAAAQAQAAARSAARSQRGYGAAQAARAAQRGGMQLAQQSAGQAAQAALADQARAQQQQAALLQAIQSGQFAGLAPAAAMRGQELGARTQLETLEAQKPEWWQTLLGAGTQLAGAAIGAP